MTTTRFLWFLLALSSTTGTGSTQDSVTYHSSVSLARAVRSTQNSTLDILERRERQGKKPTLLLDGR